VNYSQNALVYRLDMLLETRYAAKVAYS